jgi:hypothetical protein
MDTQLASLSVHFRHVFSEEERYFLCAVSLSRRSSYERRDISFRQAISGAPPCSIGSPRRPSFFATSFSGDRWPSSMAQLSGHNPNERVSRPEWHPPSSQIDSPFADALLDVTYKNRVAYSTLAGIFATDIKGCATWSSS